MKLKGRMNGDAGMRMHEWCCRNERA